MSDRRAFALLTVLWVLVGASALALAVRVEAFDAGMAQRNRLDAARASWNAFGCIERSRAAIDSVLAEAESLRAVPMVWRSLDRKLDLSPLLRGCDIRIEAAGVRLDVNSASADQLRALFSELGMPNPDEATDRLLDWLDAGDQVRPFGAERDWYLGRGSLPPFNGAITDGAELSRIAGLENAQVDTVLGVEPGRIAINRAPLAVVRTIPGTTPLLVARLEQERTLGRDVPDLLALARTVSSAAAESLLTHFDDVTRLSTSSPDAWIVTARAGAGTPPLVVHSDIRVVLTGGRGHVVRRRTW